MSVLEQVGVPANSPVIATIFGEAGLGKTSLAATFPKPIFIRAEDGLMSVPQKSRPDAFPVMTEADDIWPQVMALLQEDHQYQTLVVDSISKLETMFIEHVVKNDPKGPPSIRQALGGYGAGFDAVGGMHRRLRKAAGLLRDRKGMNVVFIGHAEVDRLEPPDGDAYTRYSLRLNQKQSLPPYVDDVDLVGFIRLEQFLKATGNDERKIALTTGARTLVCYPTASNISKNRLGIDADLPFAAGENPLAQYLETKK